jgi:RHH-type proline utilization regulon transcriptional repressor/proline dehydrogenase/delta 1-pyrroline-5-carboxylate dehydrogenase
MLTGKVLRDDRSRASRATLRGAVKRLGEPVIRTAVRRAMREMGNQFVLGEDIDAAMARARRWRRRATRYSYDMLGEAALTAEDARRYLRRLSGGHRRGSRARTPRQPPQPRHLGQALGAASALRGGPARTASWRSWCRPGQAGADGQGAGINFSIDAEEADRLDLSLDVIEAALADPGWPAGTVSASSCRPTRRAAR